MDQRVVIFLRVVGLPIVAKRSFSHRVSTDLSARSKCSVAEGGVSPLNSSISLCSMVLNGH